MCERSFNLETAVGGEPRTTRKRKANLISLSAELFHPLGEWPFFPNLFPVRVFRVVRGFNYWI